MLREKAVLWYWIGSFSFCNVAGQKEVFLLSVLKEIAHVAIAKTGTQPAELSSPVTRP